MINKETRLIRLLIFFLGGVLITTAYLVVRIYPDEIGITYMALLAATAAIGLLTNIWGGLLASIIASFAIIIIDQYIGVYPTENAILNISSELIGFLIVGPLSGMINMLLDKSQSVIEHWARVAEGRAVHDEYFGTLRPKWLLFRIEEEMLRAKRFQRPLSVALLEMVCRPGEKQTGRIAALQALIRLGRAVTQPPAVVAYIGNDQVILVLPEHDEAGTRAVLAEINKRVETEMYYPDTQEKKGVQGIGKPLKECISLRSSTVAVDGKLPAVDLIEQARSALGV